MQASRKETVFVPYLIIFLIAVITIIPVVYSDPSGPTISILDNTTKNVTTGQKINSTINGSTPGGHIFTIGLTSVQQNSRWKAYVGNVSGTLTLDDADDNTIFQWTLASIAGEVYATRASGSVNWTGINCTWIADGQTNATDGYESSNRTPEHLENIVMSHTSLSDNVTATFTQTNHSSITVGGVTIGKDDCFTANTYQNNDAQVFADSDDANFTEILLYDGAYNTSTGNLVYSTFMESDNTGYRSDETYDFQMILPEDGTPGFSGSTAYYFYVELT